MTRLLLAIILGCTNLSICAETLRFEGVLGNSGELENPVLFGSVARGTRGLGVAYDASCGVLYERAGSGRLNAYALDGRMLAHYALPESNDHRDMMTLCGERLVLLLSGKLYTLPLAAPAGEKAAALAPEVTDADTLSSSAREGRVAVHTKAGRLLLVNPSDGSLTPFGEATGNYCSGMDWDAEGNFFILFGKEANKVSQGKLVADAQWPKRFAGERESGMERATLVGAYWYGSAWHGTIKRFSSAFEPAPGVVLGGASGHFIGHVPCNYDADLARGIRQVSPGLFAIGGLYGIVQLAEWHPEAKALTLVRRIGALPDPGGIALNAQGRILAGQNIWSWKADSLAPADVSNVFRMIAPCAWLDAETAVGLAEVYGKASIAMGRFEEEQLFCNRLDRLALPKEVVGIALYRESGVKGPWRLLAVGASGQARAHEIAEDRRNPWRRDLGEVRLITASQVKRFTAVTMKDADTLLAAADGQVIEFGREGTDWKEADRWSDGFGSRLRLAVHAGRLTIADTENNRVALYSLSDRRKLAETAVAAPGEVALNGPFLAVYDSVGQRLMKYRIASATAN